VSDATMLLSPQDLIAGNNWASCKSSSVALLRLACEWLKAYAIRLGFSTVQHFSLPSTYLTWLFMSVVFERYSTPFKQLGN
jgi:hypothetical protein